MAASAGRLAGQASVAVGHTLNCDDLPEADIFPLGRGPVSFRNRLGAAAPRASKPRMKRVGMPALSEADAETENIQDIEPQQWRCKACTLLNSALLPRCEACEACGADGSDHAAAAAPGSARQPAAPPPSGPAPSLDWPALPEAREVAESWVDCDASSVASSWLDLGAADWPEDVEAGDASDADVVLVGAPDLRVVAPRPAGPPSWSAVVGRAEAAAAAPALEVAVPPPVSRRPPARPRARPAGEDGQDDEDAALDMLRESRLRGTGSCRSVRQGRARKG